MNDFDYLKFDLELLNLMIDNVEDILFKAQQPETIKRLDYCLQNLKKAYNYASPIIDRKEYI